MLNKNQLILYAITDRKFDGLSGESLYKKIEDALIGGVTVLQLREKNLDIDSFIEEAKKVKAICHNYGVPLIINDNLEVGLKSGADGVHVGVDDAPVSEIRQKVGKDFIIGATAKTVEQAKFAEASGADYLGVGAVFPSPTKQNAIRITPDKLREITASVAIPSVAIGGITLGNVNEIKGCGASGIAVVSSIFGADNVLTAAEELKEAAKNIIGEEL